MVGRSYNRRGGGWGETGIDIESNLEGVRLDAERRITYKQLDAWRGIASLWVLALHACLAERFVGQVSWTGHPIYTFSLQGSLGVQLFFVISGFCIANAAVGAFRKENVCWSFVRARIKRIYPPYLGIAFSILVWDLHRNDPGALVGLGHGIWFYVSSLTLTQITMREPLLDVVFWTLNYEVAFYAVILVFLAISVAGKWGADRVMNLAHLCTVLSLAALIVYPGRVIFPFNLWPQFGLGVLVFDLLRRPKSLSPRLMAILVAALTVAFAFRSSTEASVGQVSMRVQTWVCLAFAVTLVGLYAVDQKLSNVWPVKVLMVAGTFSYSLYLTHYVIISRIRKATEHVRWMQGHDALVLWASIVGAIAFGFVYYLFLERPFLSTTAKRRQAQEQRALGVMPVSV